MWASIDLPAQKNLYTNNDFVQAKVTVEQGPEDEGPLRDMIDRVTVSLVCESKITIGDIERFDVHYSSDAAPVTLIAANNDDKSVTYACTLQFPSKAVSENDSLLGTMILDDNGDGFHWSVRAKIYPHASEGSNPAPKLAEKPCQFIATAALPSMLDLIDTEHSEVIGSTPISIVVTHAAAGLPQTPLTAGIGLRATCGESSDKISVSRIRLILKESTTINRINGFIEAEKTAAINRWLLDDIHPGHSITLSQKPYILDHLVEDICIDFGSVIPSFETRHFSHKFDLMTEFTLERSSQYGETTTSKVTSISPVEILPRINGTNFEAYEDSPDGLSWNSAENTDSSDDGSYSSDIETDEGTASIQLSYGPNKSLFSVQELPLIHSVH